MNTTDLVAAAQELTPRLRERARATELNRNVPESTIKELHEAGLFRALQPKRYGGFELSPAAFYEATIELASACGSTGWVFGVLGVHNWQLALFPEEVQEEVWGTDASILACSSYAPTGQIERVDGGYRIRGTWNFSSGCAHSRWALLGATVVEDGVADHFTFLVPDSDYEISDVWEVVGLAGTGSNDLVIEDAFVPDRRAQSTMGAQLSESAHSSALYRLPFASVFCNAICSSAIGIAKGALDEYRRYSRHRVRASYGGQASADPFNQVRLADAAGELDDARMRLRQNSDELMRVAESGKEIPMELRVRVRRDQVRGSRAAVRSTDRVFESAGGKALFLDQPIQRAWRDVHAARVHAINDTERGLLLYGAEALGAELPPGNMV
jgi:3-hydroxy-9,10-secoandrosta-1,3,5(10)-triene-9,17-dione monooxygenase